MEHVEHDVRKLITKLQWRFNVRQVKCLMRQLLSAA
eukprot:gene19136-41563_t